MLVRAIVALALVLLVASPSVQTQQPAQSPDTQIMDWVFAMPEGWRVANSRLTPQTTSELALEHTARASDALTQVTFGRPGDIEGRFRKWFDVHWENLKRDYKAPDLEAPDASEISPGYNALAGIGAVKLDDGRQRVVMLIGVNKGKRAGVMCFITEDFEHLEANAKRLDGMLATVRFASQRPRGEKAPKLRTKIDPLMTPSFLRDDWKGWPEGEFPLEGVWGRESLTTDFYTQYGAQYRISYFYRMFFKDGTAVNRIPAEGLLSFDLDWLRSEFADYMGTYTVEGNVVTVTTGTYGGGQKHTEVLTLKDGELYLGETAYKRLPDAPPVLEGAYIKVDYERHAPEHRKQITFRGDGSFVDEGFNAMLGVRCWCGEYYWLTGFPATPGNGKWRVEKNTLELIYEDGRKHRFAFHLHHDTANNDVKHFVLNGRFMKRLGEPGKGK